MARADEEKFCHYEDEGWKVINSHPTGDPQVKEMADLDFKRLNEIVDSFSLVKEYAYYSLLRLVKISF